MKPLQILSLSTIFAAMVLALASSTSALATQATAIGDTYVYRVINRYISEPRGDITYHVDKVEPNRIFTSVSSENSLVESGRTAVFTGDGNWVRRTLDSHGKPQTIEFSTESPAYAFPLVVGKRWSMRAPARVPETGKSRSVRIDGAVIGAERIRVPAGEFDTLKITRTIYAGDANSFETETNISEIEWYAPALRRAVRSETRSSYTDLRNPRGSLEVRGDWDLYELLEVRAAKP
jgi:hypothetical protein